jgi:hypothetical protein
MEKEKDQPLKVKLTFEKLMEVATKGNPKPKRKISRKKKVKKN